MASVNIKNSNTARLYRQWRKIMFYSATNSRGGNAWRFFAPFGRHFDFLVTSIFISMTLDGVTSFSRIENVRNTCKRLYYSQNCWRDFLM